MPDSYSKIQVKLDIIRANIALLENSMKYAFSEYASNLITKNLSKERKRLEKMKEKYQEYFI